MDSESLKVRVECPRQKTVGTCRVSMETIRGVGCGFLTPPGADPESLLIFLHGGAFTDGPVEGHWSMLARICERSGVCAVMADYGLAPVRPYPAGLNDVLNVYRELRQAGRAGRAEQVFLAGDSSGGGLALSASLALRDCGEFLPEKLVLLSPWLDLTLSNPEIENIREYEWLLEREGLIEAGRVYAAGHDPNHYLLSPVNGSLAGLPPTLLLIGTHDIFVCDCRRFREKAVSEGLSLNYQEWSEMFHDWMTRAPDLPEANQAVETVAAFLSSG